MTKDEALKMAIEWLEGGSGWCANKEVIQACKEALEQPAQEPVAWMSEGGIFTRTKEHAESWGNHGGKVTPVYTHPAQSWQGLSDDEKLRLSAKANYLNLTSLLTIELCDAMLKEKNNG